MTKEKKVYIRLTKRICLFVLGIVLLCVSSDLLYAEEVSGLTVCATRTYHTGTEQYTHTPHKELTAECSLFDKMGLYLCYHQYTEEGYLLENQLTAEDITITKDGEDAGSCVEVADSTIHQDEIIFRFKETGDYIISSSVVGHEDNSVAIHVSEPASGFFTEPYRSNQNRSHFYPYEGNNVIYYFLPDNTQFNHNQEVNGGNPFRLYVRRNGIPMIAEQNEISQYFTYELLEGRTNVYKLVLNTEVIEDMEYNDYYDMTIFYESTDGSFEGAQYDMLRIGSWGDDRIGLGASTASTQNEFTGEWEPRMEKKVVAKTSVSGYKSCTLIYYDYNEENELVETIPELEDIKILKNGQDVTETISIIQHPSGSFGFRFLDGGKYRLVVKLEDGREDVVDLCVENHLYGFYTSPVVDTNELTEYQLTKTNYTVYYILSDYMKLNEDKDVNSGNPFAIAINGSKISQELQSEYFTYELVEGTENVYKIIFQTDKTKAVLSTFDMYVYYENTDTAESALNYLSVTNEIKIPNELTVSISREMDAATNQVTHIPQKEVTAECSLFDMTCLYLCYHQYTEDDFLIENSLKAENLIITKDGKEAGSNVDIGNCPTHPGMINFRFKEPGDYVISSSVEGQEEGSVTIHVSEPTVGFFTEPYCSNQKRNYFYPYDDSNTIYFIIPENTKLNDNTDVNEGCPVQVSANYSDTNKEGDVEDVSQFLTYELIDGSSNIFKITLNSEILEEDVDYYDVYFYYESTDGSFLGVKSEGLRVGSQWNDKKGLFSITATMVSSFDGSYEKQVEKEDNGYVRRKGEADQYQLIYYDYNEENALVEIIPDLEQIRIMKNGIDMTEQVSLCRNDSDQYEIAFTEEGKYRLIVTMEDGREDAIDIVVENRLYGFYESPVLSRDVLREYQLTTTDNVIYCLLSDAVKLNDRSDVNNGNPFVIQINGNIISQELQSEYFTYELVDVANNVYKLTFQTDKTANEFNICDLYAYYEYVESGMQVFEVLTVINKIATEPSTEEPPTEKINGLTVSVSRELDEETAEYNHIPQNELAAECSVVDMTLLHLCYHQYTEDGILVEYPLKADELIITKDGEPISSCVEVADSDQTKYPGMISFLFKESGDYVISSSIEGQEESFVTIHVSQPTSGFFTDPCCSNRNRYYYYPYDDKNIIYFLLLEDAKLNDDPNVNSGYPIYVVVYENGTDTTVEGEEVSRYVTYEPLEGTSNVYKLTLNTEILENYGCNYDIHVCYNLADGSYVEDSLNVGEGISDKIGLVINRENTDGVFNGDYTYEVGKYVDFIISSINCMDAFYLKYYDYGQNQELLEIIPELEDITIMKNGVDVTDDVYICQNSSGQYEMMFKETGKYRLIVTLDGGREDAVDIYVQNWMYGFYNTQEIDENELTEYQLTQDNNVVYYILSDRMKINEQLDVNAGMPFAISVNGSKVSQELQAEYFSYELVEGTQNVYKITFQTDKTKEELSNFDFYVYYEDTVTAERQMDYLFVTNEISAKKPTTEEPTTEAPTMEEPTTEEPTTEEPTTEEPTTEEPTTEESTTETLLVDGTVGKQESGLLLSNVVVNSIDAQTYHAKAIEPEVSVTYRGNQLIQGRDYIIEYKNNISVGTADILLTGIGDYSGTKEIHFQIEPYKVDGLSEILKGKDGEIYRAVYTKKKITLKTVFRLSYMIGGERQYLEPKEGRDYTSKYYNNNKIGTARIVYTFKGNYKGSVIKKFLIVPPTTKITKVKKSGNSLVISWKKISSCDRYEIYRATSKKGKYKKIATVKGKNKISYKDKKAKKGKKYYYKVKVCKKVSGTLYKSGWSNVKTGKR